MKEIKGWEKDREVAVYFGKSPQAISSWCSRNSIPLKYISSFCEREGISFDGLINPKPQISETPSIHEVESDYSPQLPNLLEMAKAIIERIEPRKCKYCGSYHIVRYGLIAICGGGGMGICGIIERA